MTSESKSKSILVVGFNARPLAFSLDQAGFEVHVVDFFGDLDLFPHVKDYKIITKELGADYHSMKGSYGKFLIKYALDLLGEHPQIDYLLIGSGLDDAIEDRETLSTELSGINEGLVSVNNNPETIKKARDLPYLHEMLRTRDLAVPKTIPLSEFSLDDSPFSYPFILKNSKSSGGMGVIKVNGKADFEFRLRVLDSEGQKFEDWRVQEYLEGIPVSCTIMSNGKDPRIISINRQVIGEKFLNAPKEFSYCGNVVPANLLKQDQKAISDVSLFLAEQLKLKGINGFDYVLRNNHPYLMEINPRIPGSIRASEMALNLNLLDLHVKSFDSEKWPSVQEKLERNKPDSFATKLIYFAPKEISKEKIKQINAMEHVHDKSIPRDNILPKEPVCTILYGDQTFSDSYFGALKIVNKIKDKIS